MTIEAWVLVAVIGMAAGVGATVLVLRAIQVVDPSDARTRTLETWLDFHMRVGDPLGSTRRIPVPPGTRRHVISTGTDGHGARIATIEETSRRGAPVPTVHVWIEAGVDADVWRQPDGSTTRTHATRGGLADRVVTAIGSAVPEARQIWAAAGTAPEAVRNDFDGPAPGEVAVGTQGDGPVGHIGLSLAADRMTNPVAWVRWLRHVVVALADGRDPRDPPALDPG